MTPQDPIASLDHRHRMKVLAYLKRKLRVQLKDRKLLKEMVREIQEKL